MRLFNLFKLSLACLLASGMAFAQGVGASGDIKGTVSDPTGAIIASGTVTATEVEKGIKHTVTTDGDGTYRFVGLLPTVYSVSASKSGFQTETAKSVTVNIGQTMIVDFHLKISSVSESVEVTTEPPVVETERSHQANVITEQYIRDLPINRRDYLTFTQLAPAVTDSTRLGGDQDFRVKQTPQSGLSFYGSNGRGNSVTVDGGEANDDSGGVRLTMSQEAVQEFQVNRSNYGADLGGASGASINIISKTGTNNVHGSLFGFFRNDALDARNPFAFTQALAPGQVFNPAAADTQGTATKDSLTREQFGGSVGFPISRDRTFLFTSFEGLIQDSQNAVPLLTNTSLLRPDSGRFTGNNQQAIINGLAALAGNPAVPCLTGQPALPAVTCAGILTNALTTSSLTGLSPAQTARNTFLTNQLESNGGLFAYPTREYLGSARWDHHFDDHNQIYLRYSFAHDNEQNPDVQSLVGFSAGSSVHALDHTAQAAWFHQFSPKTLNELRSQFNYTDFNVIPNEPGEVALDIPGFAKLGTNIFLPSLTIMRRYEFADNATVIRGNHTMKFGFYELIRGNHTESHTFFPGRFVFGSLPGGALSPCLQVPAACGLTGVNAAVLNSLQSASLGVPQFYQQGFGDPTYNYPRPFTAAYWQDTWNIRPNFTLTFGARYELDSQYGPLDTDNNNIAPRASFAWDPFKNHKTVVRAGYGIFYSPVYGQIADVVQTLGLVNGNRQIAQVFVPANATAPLIPLCVNPQGNPTGILNSGCIFQTLFGQGRVQCLTPAPGQAGCITPANLTQFGINITHTGPVPPLSVLFSGQPDYQNPYAQQAEFGIEREVWGGISVSASYVYVHTVHLPVAIDANLLPAPLETRVSPFNGKSVSFRNWDTTAGHPCNGVGIVTCFASPALLQGNVYSSAGRAVYHGGILEIKKRFSHHMSLLANYTYSKALSDVTDFNSDFAPFDQTNLRGERGPADFDQRHKLVMASVFTSPAKNAFFSGFELAPVIRYNSGHPYNVLAGGANVNNDRHSTNDRPLGFGRNAGIGPDFFDVDLRLARRFKITEKAGLQFVAEAFNLFNRTNFGAVNNEYTTFNGFVNPAFASTSPSGFFLNSAVNPPGNAQGAFTSGAGSFARRQLQLGARLTF